jgi:hypothetical protein
LIQINDKNIRDMAEIKTYDVIKNYAEDGKAALASQIWDEGQQKFQSQINQEGSITQQEFNAIFND